MEKITITKKSADDGKWQFDVTITDDETTHHTVTLDKDYWSKLTNETTSPEELIRKSFEFLLARESNEAILKQFNLKVIQTYFPEYENKIANN